MPTPPKDLKAILKKLGIKPFKPNEFSKWLRPSSKISHPSPDFTLSSPPT